MGKKPTHKIVLKKEYKPLVSVCTPTFNRRPFIPIMFECFRNQTYPKNRIEWIIVDDGTDNIKDLIDSANIPQIKYFKLDKKMSLGEKRNYMHKQCKGSIIVYMDDDDYYPPERVSHAVDTLMANPNALCAGASEMYIYFKHINQMYQCGPYGPNHATAGTFAFKSRLLDDTQYEDHAALAEEKAFLKNYTIPFVQLDPLKAILVFSHNHNTFDKKKMLENPHPDFMKPSNKTVDMFIKGDKETHIKKFFLDDIDNLLENYEPGRPENKPDVIAQTKILDEQRNRMQKEMEEQRIKQLGTITMELEGQPSKQLTFPEIVDMLQKQQNDLINFHQRNKELEDIIRQLQQQLVETHLRNADNVVHETSSQNKTPDVSKTTPEVIVDL